MVEKMVDTMMETAKADAPIYVERCSDIDQDPPDHLWLFSAAKEKTSSYLGYVHGIAGILHTMFNAPYTTWKKHESALLKTIEWILRFQQGDGNFKCTPKDEKTELVHFCHGAPGFILLISRLLSLHAEGTIALAPELKDKLTVSLKKAADCVWEKGLLKKGINLCHGVAGSAYVLLQLAVLPKGILSDDERRDYLWKATRFASFGTDWKTKGFETMDVENSLFFGVSGAVVMWSDLLTVLESKDGRGDGKFIGFPFACDY
ncbi:hypothetical protein BT69DRAFT_1353233 [Atractiella rhizophila]|nr:hypothetical protein BT69DRAFT_1353233 [Atractiella rhizophila]